MSENQPLLYSRKLAAQALSLSVRSIDYLLAAGKIQTVRVGSKVLIPAKELQKFARTGHSGDLSAA